MLGVIGCNSDENSDSMQVNEANVFPIINERISFSMYITPPPNVIDIHNNEAILWLEDYTNIDLDLEVGPHDYSKGKLELLLASGTEMPDILFTNDAIPSELQNIYGNKGVLIAINDYIDDYAPNLKHAIEHEPQILKQITMDNGNIYTFPKYTEEQHVMYSQKMWVNKKWLDYLGLEVPNTIDEFYEVLKAFRDNDCNQNGIYDEIPFAGMTDKWRTDFFGYIMQPFTMVSIEEQLYMIRDKNDKIVAPIFDENFLHGISYLNQLYNEGLIDENVFTTDSETIKTYTGSVEGNRIGFIQSGALATVVDLNEEGAREDFVAFKPLKSLDDGIRRTPYFKPNARGVFAITSSCENIEAAVRLGDLLMIDPFGGDSGQMEVGLNVWYGPNGWSIPEEGVNGLNDEQALYQWEFQFGTKTNLNYANLSSLFNTYRKKAHLAWNSQEYNHEKVLWDSTKENYEPYGVDCIIPSLVVPASISKQYNEIKIKLQEHMNQNLVKFVVGIRPLSEWDMFLEELESLGFNWYIGETQKAYDNTYN